MRHLRYPSVEEILEIHDRVLAETGGQPGIINRGNLEFALDQARSARGLFRGAAHLLHGILLGHPFADGNKRASLAAADLLLSRNGYELRLVSEERTAEFLAGVLSGEILIPETAEWLKNRSKKL